MLIKEKDVFETYESEVRSYCRKFPAEWEKAKGVYIYDTNGKEYLDFFCGAGALNYGHNNPYIKEKVISYLQNDGITHAMDMFTKAKCEFITYMEENILKVRGLDYKIMFPGPTGTNSVEAALKLARKVKGRSNVFALMGCFHGMSLGTLALTTEKMARGGAGVSLENVTHIPAPYMFDNLDTIEFMQKLLDDDHSGVEKPAALVLETVQAEGGIYPLDTDWLKRARDFCSKNDILLICDEIQVGCARTGSFFSFERAGIKPDIFCMSKSIGGMGFPFALTFIKPEYDVWKPGEHNGTFRGFQPAMVAAKAGLEFMLKNQLEKEVEKKGKIINDFLKKELNIISKRIDYRGVGLIWGIDFNNFPDGTALKCSKECFDNGLIIELAGRKDCVLKLMPPLTINSDELFKGLNIIINSIKKILKEL
ncbi:MAG: diaminobutyrate--2-oxoglutarate transaminase [Selenomonas ruminantium]|jgi:diaminobutyrate-2-oxoglutarate transaminase|uniref:Diaminobutyrate--2-oxoglutarate transaminase n=1 Tax=Selenomonas ruminantium TaxID=971 RepID=A0A927WKH9_SELRU|nr:diaminobutyrate--2-oxoglutarate transaminase [Selenomonas ruminantium]MBE6085654.1 diaminobutyrate--2-oxoglutarate transaminase [Selenomonas ruminantium]